MLCFLLTLSSLLFKIKPITSYFLVQILSMMIYGSLIVLVFLYSALFPSFNPTSQSNTSSHIMHHVVPNPSGVSDSSIFFL
ncbi:hypothetical protein Lalb_Chr24g0399491 [Lupinus albus]|uniref:Uncharacterized protein n=1 Tax=Lupinus albus TaxID=3870 RepID=A0A6A4N459_LUPAL|nr:hypothetical protein Lalb_Chr24g0399491 [Lupinus albus]